MSLSDTLTTVLTHVIYLQPHNCLKANSGVIEILWDMIQHVCLCVDDITRCYVFGTMYHSCH